MSKQFDELKLCAHCGKVAKLMSVEDEYNPYYWIECVFCHVQTDAYCEKDDAIAVWNARVDSENKEPSLKEPTEDTQVLSDSREKLNEELMDSCLTFANGGGHLRAFAYVSDLLDRQAAIIERKCQLEYDAVAYDRDYFRKHVQQMNEFIEKLVAERDRLQKVVQIQADSFQKLERELKEALNG